VEDAGVNGAVNPVLKGARERSPMGRGGGNEGDLCSSSSWLREWLGEAREVEDAGFNGVVDPVLKGARERDPVLKGVMERSLVGSMDQPPPIRWGR
jgi:hypothetical protein